MPKLSGFLLFRNLPPLLEELRHYGRKDVVGDLSAGLTVGILVIPQAMAYAMLAGLPAVYGLYATVVPLMVYALWGSSRLLSLGPAALLSLLIASGVQPMAATGTPEYISWAIALALAAGIMQFLLGAFRLGFLVNFLSAPVVSGFTSAAAVTIILTQVGSLLGIRHRAFGHLWDLLQSLWIARAEFNGIALLIGAVSLALLLMVRRYRPHWPAALLVIALGIVFCDALDLSSRGVPVMGNIPRGFPMPALPDVQWRDARPLLPSVLSISLMGFVISVAVARNIPGISRGGRMEPDRELRAQGLANVFGAIFQGFPVAGSFSRTAVNLQAGARTGVAGLFTSLFVLLTILFFTPLFRLLPLSVLAAIIIVAVLDLFQWKIARQLSKTDRTDFIMWCITFSITLLAGMQTGMLSGVVLSLAALIYSTSRPHYAVLGRLPNTTTYKNIERFTEAEEEEGILLFRPDARLFFGNQEYIREAMERELALRPETELLLIDASAVNWIDSTAISMLRELQAELSEEGVALRFIGLIGPVRDLLERSGLKSMIGKDPVTARIHDEVIRFRKEEESGAGARPVAAKVSGSTSTGRPRL